MDKAVNPRIHLFDAYRAIAAILVVLYHFTIIFKANLVYDFLGGFFLFGQSAVDFFFILSAFVVTYRYSQMRADRKSVTDFLKKRFLRIYPSYWITAAGVLLIYAFAQPSTISFEFILSSITLYPHWPRLIAPSWTLAYEVFFYLLFVALLFIKKKTIAVFISMGLGILVLFYNVSSSPIPMDKIPFIRNFLEFATSFVTIEFLLGTLFCIIFFKLRAKIPHSFALMLLLCSSVILFGVWGLYHTIFVQINGLLRLMIIVLPMSLLILSTALYETKTVIKLPHILKTLGESSYSIFITHSVILSLYYRIIQTMRLPNNLMFYFVIIGVFLALSFGVLFHECFERRMLKKFKSSL